MDGSGPIETAAASLRRQEQRLRADALAEAADVALAAHALAARACDLGDLASLPAGVANALTQLARRLGDDLLNLESLIQRSPRP